MGATAEATATDDVVIGQVPKSAGEMAQVRVSVYRGVVLVDVRSWMPPLTEAGTFQPTRKGVSARPEVWAELLPMIQRAVAQARRRTRKGPP